MVTTTGMDVAVGGTDVGINVGGSDVRVAVDSKVMVGCEFRRASRVIVKARSDLRLEGDSVAAGFIFGCSRGNTTNPTTTIAHTASRPTTATANLIFDFGVAGLETGAGVTDFFNPVSVDELELTETARFNAE